MTVYGYARVSSKDQNIDRQLIALHEAGVKKKNIFVDKQSGKDFDRPKYKELFQKLKKGDVLFIQAIDRLGRNYEDTKEQWNLITKKKKADIVVLNIKLIDTREDQGPIGRLMADVVFELLTFIAQYERDCNKERQRQGIAAAKERGVVFGPPRIKEPENFREIYEKWKTKQINAGEAARLSGMSESTFYKHANEIRKTEHTSTRDIPRVTKGYIMFDNEQQKKRFWRTYTQYDRNAISSEKAAKRLNLTEKEFLRQIKLVKNGGRLRIKSS